MGSTGRRPAAGRPAARRVAAPRRAPAARPGPASPAGPATPAARPVPSPERRRPALTTRAALLGLVVIALAVLLALPLRTYLGQHGEITGLQAQQAEQRHRVEQLREQVRRAQDPAVVEQQARERLQYARPGERDYVVLTPPPPAPPPPPRDRASTLLVADPNRAWWSTLWDTDGSAAR